MHTCLLLCDSGMWVDAISRSSCSQTLDMSQTDLEHIGQQYLQPHCTHEDIFVRDTLQISMGTQLLQTKEHHMLQDL
jgi:hypothetical protein